MSPGGDRPALAAGWPDALGRGFAAFVAVAVIGQLLALAAWAVADTGASIGSAVRLGWIEFGAFHHVAIQLRVPDLDLAPAAGPGATSLSVGVALLSITAVAIWLLFRGGRAVADRYGGGAAVRMLHGSKVAPAYALPAFALAALVEVRTPFRLGAFASGELHVSLSKWQALVFPLAIATGSGAAGGLRSAFDARARDGRRPRRTEAVVAGGLRMFAFGLLLSYAGLFAAGVVQPDGPAALFTPSTARYFSAVFARPEAGAMVLGHHLALAPNQALWTLVPVMGGCDVVRGSVRADVLCFGRFPTDVGTTVQPLAGGETVRVPMGEATFGRAPLGYFLFLLVPAAATVLGGRLAAERASARGRAAAALGAGAGLVFAALVAVGAALSTLTVGYGAGFGGAEAAGWVVAGPNLVTGPLLAAAWGLVGGALGGISLGRRASLRTSSTGRTRSEGGSTPR